jgi:hypothetical protein
MYLFTIWTAWSGVLIAAFSFSIAFTCTAVFFGFAPFRFDLRGRSLERDSRRVDAAMRGIQW